MIPINGHLTLAMEVALVNHQDLLELFAELEARVRTVTREFDFIRPLMWTPLLPRTWEAPPVSPPPCVFLRKALRTRVWKTDYG